MRITDQQVADLPLPRIVAQITCSQVVLGARALCYAVEIEMIVAGAGDIDVPIQTIVARLKRRCAACGIWCGSAWCWCWGC
jgi:hypothetical protein